VYLTRFEINPERRAAKAFLATPQKMHAAVLAAFPESQDDPAEGRILWRVDPGAHGAALYLVSPGKPDLTHLVEQIGRPTYGWQTRDYGPFLDRLGSGDRWAFRLRANPVHNIVPANGTGRGKRLGHVTPAQQAVWFLRAAERRGFRIVEGGAGEPDMVVQDRRTLRFDRQGRRVTLVTAVFEGTLVVDDPTHLRAALVGGIGPGKGYGCGLMTLAAAPGNRSREQSRSNSDSSSGPRTGSASSTLSIA
jgi:CRISPR system Cascade subunit CasE